MPRRVADRLVRQTLDEVFEHFDFAGCQWFGQRTTVVRLSRKKKGVGVRPDARAAPTVGNSPTISKAPGDSVDRSRSRSPSVPTRITLIYPLGRLPTVTVAVRLEVPAKDPERHRASDAVACEQIQQILR